MSPLLGRSGSRLALAALAIGGLLLPSVARALPVPPTFNWRASAPGTDPALWNATVGTHQWDVTGASAGGTSSAYPGITGSFDLGAGASITGTSFQSIDASDPSDESMSLELWFRPASLTGGQQVLFETGGNQDGLSILLDDDVLTFRVKDNGTVVTTTANLTANGGEFYQAAITLALNSTATLYVDGLFASGASATGLNDWSNTNAAGIGTRAGQLGSNSGSTLNGYGDFLGEIALLRFYQGQVLTAAQVQQNFDAVATPEPGTAVLLALGLVGLAARRRLS